MPGRETPLHGDREPGSPVTRADQERPLLQRPQPGLGRFRSRKNTDGGRYRDLETDNRHRTGDRCGSARVVAARSVVSRSTYQLIGIRGHRRFSIDVRLILAPFCRSAPNMSLFPPVSIPTNTAICASMPPFDRNSWSRPMWRVTSRRRLRNTAHHASPAAPLPSPHPSPLVRS